MVCGLVFVGDYMIKFYNGVCIVMEISYECFIKCDIIVDLVCSNVNVIYSLCLF